MRVKLPFKREVPVRGPAETDHEKALQCAIKIDGTAFSATALTKVTALVTEPLTPAGHLRRTCA
jgi:hypothetical protein